MELVEGTDGVITTRPAYVCATERSQSLTSPAKFLIVGRGGAVDLPRERMSYSKTRPVGPLLSRCTRRIATAELEKKPSGAKRAAERFGTGQVPQGLKARRFLNRLRPD